MAKTRVVAIDIGTHTAKMVQLERSATAVELVDASVMTYSDQADRQQVVKALEALWASLSLRKPPTQGSLGSLFNRHKTEVVLALPRFLVNTKRLTHLPAAADSQLANIVAIAAETELPFRVEEAIFTYHDVQRTSEATSVELISTRRATVTNYLELLEQIGILATGVTPSMIAIAEVAANSAGTAPTFIVDIGAGQTDFCFLEGGSLRFSRSFSLGGNHLSEQVSRALNVDIETAAAEKRHLSAREAPTDTWTLQFIGELRRSIAAATAHRESGNLTTAADTEGYGNVSFPEKKTELWLCGGGARVPDLAAICEAELNIPTQLWNPLHSLQQHAAIDIRPARSEAKTILDEWGDTFAVPLGVGLSALKPAPHVSLLPKETADTLAQATRQRKLFAAAGLGALMVGGILFGGYTLQRSQQYKADVVAAELASYAQPMAAAQAQLGRELALTDMLAHHISPLDILHALSEMFRDRTQVAWTNFNVTNLNEPTRARITFNLESASHNAINMLLGRLDRSKVFTNIRPGEVTTMSKEKKQIFQVQVRCNLTPSAVQAFAKKRYPIPRPQGGEATADAEPSVAPPAPRTEYINEKEE